MASLADISKYLDGIFAPKFGELDAQKQKAENDYLGAKGQYDLSKTAADNSYQSTLGKLLLKEQGANDEYQSGLQANEQSHFTNTRNQVANNVSRGLNGGMASSLLNRQDMNAAKNSAALGSKNSSALNTINADRSSSEIGYNDSLNSLANALSTSERNRNSTMSSIEQQRAAMNASMASERQKLEMEQRQRDEEKRRHDEIQNAQSSSNSTIQGLKDELNRY